MADIAIRASATAAVPRDYTIPGAQEILPKAVSASFDGTGAAGQFFPCLQVLDPGGNVMFTAVSQTILSPGASADVSWFPGLGATGQSASASGAWTQVFHVDLPNVTTATSIDTVGSVWSNANNQIFGVFMGSSKHLGSPDELFVVFDNDTAGHNTYSRFWGDASPSATPGTLHNDANGSDVHGTLGLAGAESDSLTTTGIFFVIPKVFVAAQSAKVISFGGYAGISTGVNAVTINSYTSAEINRLEIHWKSGAQFEGGSSLTLWAV